MELKHQLKQRNKGIIIRLNGIKVNLFIKKSNIVISRK